MISGDVGGELLDEAEEGPRGLARRVDRTGGSPATDRVASLVLYEAVTSIDKTPTEFIQRLERMVNDGEYERALVTPPW